MKLYHLQISYYSTKATNNREVINDLFALHKESNEKNDIRNKEIREGIAKCEKNNQNVEKELEKVLAKAKATYDQSWSLRNENNRIKWELDFLRNREKRRSENRRVKRQRKKQRRADAKGSNLTAEGDQSEE